MQSQQRLGIERFPPYWGKKSGFGSSQSSSSAEGNVTGRVQSEGQLGELGLFSLNEQRLRKCCEVVQESLFLCEGQDSPSQAALSFSLAVLEHLLWLSSAGLATQGLTPCPGLRWPFLGRAKTLLALLWRGSGTQTRVSSPAVEDRNSWLHYPSAQLTRLAILELPPPVGIHFLPQMICAGLRPRGCVCPASPSSSQPLCPRQEQGLGLAPCSRPGQSGEAAIASAEQQARSCRVIVC